MSFYALITIFFLYKIQENREKLILKVHCLQGVPLFPIRKASEITGVNSVTLRAWERRYGLIQPHRTVKGHRLYSEANIEDIKAILRLLNQGIAISHVGDIFQQNKLIEQKNSPQSDIWSLQLKKIITAVERFDEYWLDQIYNEILSLYSINVVTRQLLLPLLDILGGRWKQ